MQADRWRNGGGKEGREGGIGRGSFLFLYDENPRRLGDTLSRWWKERGFVSGLIDIVVGLPAPSLSLFSIEIWIFQRVERRVKRRASFSFLLLLLLLLSLFSAFY